MLLIRYEKDSLKDYIVYEIPDEHIAPITSADNGFEMCYFNNNSINIRMYFKVIVYNKNIRFFIDNIFNFINNIFDTVNTDWTITLNERMFNNDHISSLYFYSNKYHINIKYLKSIIDCLHHSDIIFDTTIYYAVNPKYKNIVTTNLPNQIAYPFKKYKKFKLLCGNPNSLILTNTDNLTEYY